MKPKSTLRHFLCIASSALICIFHSHAANVTWDITPGTVGVGDSAVTGGTGAWNTADGNWTIDGGVNNLAWDNSMNDTAIFGVTAGIITLGTGITVGGLQFDTAGYTITGDTLTFGAAGNIAANVDATISSILAGSVAINKTGPGVLTLTADNSHTGARTVSTGTLILANANTISGATSVAATGTLQLGNATSMGTSTMTLASGATLQLRNDADTIFTAPIATAPTTGVTYNFNVNNAASAVTDKKLTLGNLTFATNSVNTVTNRINVTGGNGYVLGLGAISAPSSASSFHPAVINATTAAVTIAKFTTGSFGSAVTLQGGNAITLSNFEMGSNSNNSLTVSGSGTVAILGTTTATNSRSSGSAAYTLTSGTLNLTTNTSLANVRVSGTTTAPTFAINGGTLNNTSGAALALAGNSGTTAGSPITAVGGSFTFGTASSTSLNNLSLGNANNGTIAANLTITFAGTGTTLTKGGTTTNTGGNQTTTVNGPGNTLSLSNYELSNTSTSRISAFSGSGNVNIIGTVSNGGGSLASGLTYSGTGTLSLNGANTYAGPTAAQSGNLVAGNNSLVSTNGAFGNAASEINLGLAGGNSDAAILTGGAFTIGRTIRLLTNTATDVGTRVLTLGSNTATNSIFSGNIILGSDSQAGRGVTLTAAASGQVTFSGIIQDPASMAVTSYTVTKSGAGTVVLSNSNAYTGATAITGGTLRLGANNVLPNASNVSIGTATLDADTRTDTAGTLDVTGSAVINLGAGAAVAFANSNAVASGVWAGAINITGTFVPGNDVDPGVGVNPGSIRFGVDNTGLTASQLADITVNGSGTYTLDAFGYLKSSGANTYATWIGANGPATGFVTDSDNDGISNGVENVLGSNPNTYNAGLTEVSATTNSVIFKHSLNPTIASDVTYNYQWSTDMVEWKASTETNTGGTTATIVPSAPALGVVTVTTTITGGPSAKLFGRLNVVKAP